MALVTIANTSGLVLNTPEVGGNGVSPDAVGGNITRPIPFPFGSNGAYAVAASKQLPVRERDLIIRQQPQQPSMPADELNELVQKGWITFTAAVDATPGDVEDEFINAV